jgi:hypothetical protein
MGEAITNGNAKIATGSPNSPLDAHFVHAFPIRHCEDTMPEPRDHMRERNWLETILHKVPGFRGYLDKENRRESDALQREWLADRLQRSKRALDEHTRRLADEGKIDQLPQFDRLRGKTDKLIGRIRGAMQGYSGVFDLVRVDEALLDRVYEHDVILMERIEHLSTAVEKLKQAAGDTSTTPGELSSEFDEVERSWDRREDLLKGLE